MSSCSLSKAVDAGSHFESRKNVRKLLNMPAFCVSVYISEHFVNPVSFVI